MVKPTVGIPSKVHNAVTMLIVVRIPLLSVFIRG
jgi:hypothetical protein